MEELTMPSKTDPSRLYHALAERLRRGDESVLLDILRDLAPKVRNRLRSRFGHFLSEDDYDDLLSMALYRLWMLREKYEPEKGSLASWFYLISRSLAWDFLRQHPRPAQLAVETLAEWAEARPQRETPVPQSEDLKRLHCALDSLPEIDRRILLAFASRVHEDDWTSDLVAELAMPASTIRVRKFRALAELRDLLGSANAPSAKVRTAMTRSRKRPPKSDEVHSGSGSSSSGQSWQASDPNADFVPSHEDLMEKIVRKLLTYKERRAKTQARAGLPQVEAEWNAALLEGKEVDDRNLEGLKKTYAWLTALASQDPQHHSRLSDFFHRVRLVGQPVSDSIQEQLGDLEQAFSSVATKIELKMPQEVCQAGEGEIILAYQTGDIALRWQGNQSSPPLSLRNLVKSALASSPRWAGQNADAVATCLIETIQAAGDLPLPNLHYPAELKEKSPQKLSWRRAKPSKFNIATSLPKWMQENQYAPSEETLDLFHTDPELADLLEKVAIDAALVDWQRCKASDEVSATPSAVQELVQALVQRSGLTRPEIAALLTPRLFDRQERVESPQECAANTKALALLWAEISG
jgi:RNA polymerase sigma factor (sigma-70 family)